MVKRLVHLFLAFVFPLAVFFALLKVVLFNDESLGNSWLPDYDEMLKNCNKNCNK